MMDPIVSQTINPSSILTSRVGEIPAEDELRPASPLVSSEPAENRQSEHQRRAGRPSKARDSIRISEEAREISQLAARDREVRAHEAAHAAAGGRYAGSPSLSYEKGPDGRSYAVGGEVPIDVSAISGDPQATLQKAQVVRAAALAPAQPSAQDLQIASRASAMAAKARSDIASEPANILKEKSDSGIRSGSGPSGDETSEPAAESVPAAPPITGFSAVA